MLLALCAVHAMRALLLSDVFDQEMLRAFAFVPARYDAVAPRELIGPLMRALEARGSAFVPATYLNIMFSGFTTAKNLNSRCFISLSIQE